MFDIWMFMVSLVYYVFSVETHLASAKVYVRSSLSREDKKVVPFVEGDKCLALSTPRCVVREDLHKLVNLVLLLLQDTLCDPDQVADFLLLQLHVGVETCKMELALECKF